MREMDHYTIEKIGVPGLVLMENAARSWVQAAFSYLKKEKPIFIFCGAGNNGGDGYAIARNLANRGYDCNLIAVKPPKSEDCLKNAEIWCHYGVSLTWRDFLGSDLKINEDCFIIDAVLGTGIESAIRGDLIEIIQLIDNLKGFKLAVDMPSGISASTGDVMGVAIKNQVTITFQKLKIGHCLYPGNSFAGEVICQNITILERYSEQDRAVFLSTSDTVKGLLPVRRKDSYKNQFGHLLTWCGSPGTIGASFLASYASLKTGAGLVTAALPEGSLNAFLAKAPELMTRSQNEISSELLSGFDAIVIGCGLGREQSKWEGVVKALKTLKAPVVLDADAFYGISDWKKLPLKNFVLTPHPGEFANLSGFDRPLNNKERLEQGLAFISAYPTTLVLKGAPTLVFMVGGRVFINSTGNSGMSTAGSGDVLSGIIGGFLAQGLCPEDASLLAVWLHGKSADIYTTNHTEETLTATSLIESLETAIRFLK